MLRDLSRMRANLGTEQFVRLGLAYVREYPSYVVKAPLSSMGVLDRPSFTDFDPPYRLNLGAGRQQYEGYVPVDVTPFWPHCVPHDVTEPFPLPDESVEHVLSEHCIEHLPEHELVPLFDEIHRLLKPGRKARIGCPDYDNPRERQYIERGEDPRYPFHSVLTHRALVERLLERSKFEEYEFLHYYEDDVFHMKDIDYSEGWLRRTPEHSTHDRDGEPHGEKSLVFEMTKKA